MLDLSLSTMRTYTAQQSMYVHCSLHRHYAQAGTAQTLCKRYGLLRGFVGFFLLIDCKAVAGYDFCVAVAKAQSAHFYV